jgi:hypothetical protein
MQASQKPPLRQANKEPMRARGGRQFRHSQYMVVLSRVADSGYVLATVTRHYALCITFNYHFRENRYSSLQLWR